MLNRFVISLALFFLALAARADTVTVYAFNFNFTTDPTHAQIIEPVIHVGDTIHWQIDVGTHCTNACSGMSETWASGALAQGTTFDHTFTHAGTFGFYCCIHGFDNNNGTGGGMSGTVTVLPPAQLSGTVTLGSFNGTVAGQQVTVIVRNPGSTTALDTYNTTLDSSGNYSVSTTRTGTFDVAIKGTHWLRRVVANVSFGSSGASGVNATLINGDINGDNVISLADFGLLRAAFGSNSSSGNWNPNADLNGDGVVSLADFGILRSNFGQQGDP